MIPRVFIIFQKPDGLVEIVPGVDDKVFGKLALFKKKNGVFIEGE